MTKISRQCPDCGCIGELYRNLKHNTFSVSCKADDANFHGEEGISDWCPEGWHTESFYTSEEAILAWNAGKILRSSL